ncbi:MAG TPA: hypothetical protein VF750_04395 [Sphingomicrobium sp.]
MFRRLVTLLTIAGVALAGCSSRPRNFAPVLAAAPTDPAFYEGQVQTCREEVALHTKHGAARGGSAAAGVAAGAGAGVATSAALPASFASYGGAAAAASLVIMAVPVFALGGAWGLSKIKKTKKERAIKTAMAQCLERSGYSVASWRVMKKRELLRAKADMALAATTATP